ncbi:major facilitator superfamily domain-containing protein [Aspergillus bertholletiae]|uniref:Major facilitator superfamily domain-containing protein n=1 Tax=Aspergillus bertholletiae TaxID=1226010 RepID=A0A5N7BDK0_9EURO|nr:major facilitator superfamily domain-containing protein [Aspergillus bertholletiae]
MGRYQWQLMISCGFALPCPKPGRNSALDTQHSFPPHNTQTSIFGVSIFTAVYAGSPNWAALNIFIALAAFFGGGNLAIDLTILAESLPRKWAFLLTSLACLWGLGNAVTGLIAWPLVVNFCCLADATPETCTKVNNMGWRYLYIILGGLCLVMSVLRMFALGMSESPKWLVSRGELNEAIASINTISKINKSTYVMTADQLRPHEQEDTRSAIKKVVSMIRALLHGPKQIRSMICLILLWLLIGVAYPVYTVFLPYYLEAHGANLGDGSTYQTCRDWTISSAVGIWGPMLTGACAAFAGAFTTVKSEPQNLAFSSMISFWPNALHAGFVPGHWLCGLTLACGRIAPLSAPFIATFGDVTTSVPIWVCCAFFMLIGIVSLVLPFEPGHFRMILVA